MLIYHYDKDTCEYLGTSEADTCPVSGKPIIPAWATDQTPAMPGANQKNVWQNGAWALQDIPQPPTPPELTAAEKQAQDIAALDAEYEPQFAALAQSLGLATLDGNQIVIDGIKSDYAALKAEYQTKREAIMLG